MKIICFFTVMVILSGCTSLDRYLSFKDRNTEYSTVQKSLEYKEKR